MSGQRDQPIILCQETHHRDSKPPSLPIRGLNSNYTNRAASRKSRVYYMYQFLVSTYPSIFRPFPDDEHEVADVLTLKNYGAPVGADSDPDSRFCKDSLRQRDDVIILDVAGGKGDLSWFINNLHPTSCLRSKVKTISPTNNESQNESMNDNFKRKIRISRSQPYQGIYSVVMDPRPTNHRSLVKSAQFLEVTHPDLVQQRNVPGTPTFQPIAALLPLLIKCRDYSKVKLHHHIHNYGDVNDCDGSKMKEMSINHIRTVDKITNFPPRNHEHIERDEQSCLTMTNNDTDKRAWRDAGSLRIHVDADLVRHVQQCITRLPRSHRYGTSSKHYMKQQSKSSMSMEPQRRPDTNQRVADYFRESDEDHTDAYNENNGDGDTNHYESEIFEEWKRFWKRARDRSEQLHPCISEVLPTTTTATSDDAALRALEIISRAKLIVGFHPDQATEAIVDLALHLRIPYCIVPCCVFPSDFPHRTVVVPSSNRVMGGSVKEEENKLAPRLQVESCNGKSKVKVRDYALFLEYLRIKHPKVRTGKLDFPYTKLQTESIFEGSSSSAAKNIVLYTLPEDMIM